MSFFKKKIRNTIRVSNSFNLDQDQHSVSPDLGPNCLQSLSADDKNLPLTSKELNSSIIFVLIVVGGGREEPSIFQWSMRLYSGSIFGKFYCTS